MMTSPTYSDWFSERVGGRNWVIAARRTSNLVRRYGESVIVVTPARSKKLEAMYHAAYGHPYDPNRQRMYRALDLARAALPAGHALEAVTAALHADLAHR